MPERVYIAIDLKSYYASVECVERGLDPLTTNLVVADPERTDKTICLAVSPSLKEYHIPGRARLFEVVRKVEEINRIRLRKAIEQRVAVRVENQEDYHSYQPDIASCNNRSVQNQPVPEYCFTTGSFDAKELAADASKELTYIIAPPRMALYMKYSTKIFSIYLKYVSPEDIHVYSIDQCFIDATNYLKSNEVTAQQFAMMMIREVICLTGITATAGIGTNLYLCKVAMDIVAKHKPPDENGVRIAELTEDTYRQILWNHTPLTDFWRVGNGTVRQLSKYGIYTMGDIARYSETCPELLYKLFGIEAELLIDHAWGWEPCTIELIKKYRPHTHSITKGQVLSRPYTHEEGNLIIKEMADDIAMELVSQNMSTKQVVLSVCYDTENVSVVPDCKDISMAVDWYGRYMPRPAHGTLNLQHYTSSSKILRDSIAELYERIACAKFTIRRVSVVAANVISKTDADAIESCDQITMFQEPNARLAANVALVKEHCLQKTILGLKHRYGKNIVLSAMSYQKSGTAITRNMQIGGHKAGGQTT